MPVNSSQKTFNMLSMWCIYIDGLARVEDSDSDWKVELERITSMYGNVKLTSVAIGSRVWEMGDSLKPTPKDPFTELTWRAIRMKFLPRRPHSWLHPLHYAISTL